MITMKKIDEAFLHFLWKNQFLAGIDLSAPGGEKIEVKDPGIHNHDAGPDFFNARVLINDTLWVGNVELHINASDWFRHGHKTDPSYDSVILHVVYFNDSEVTRSSGERIPVAVLRFPTLLWDRYKGLKQADTWIPCQDKLADLPPVHVAQWLSALMVEKLKERTEYLQRNMEDVNRHWDAIFSRIIFRSFGLPVNTTPFEILSLVTPYNLLLRNRQSTFTLEALLFGMSGLLNTTIANDKYTESLKNEFSRFSGKIEQAPVPYQSWKFLRMRPSAFPTIRIAQLAAFIQARYPPNNMLSSLPSPEKIYELCSVKASDYWNTHYHGGKKSKSKEKRVGRQFMHLLIINSIVPYAFFYGKSNSENKFCDYAIDILEQIPAENNGIIKKWSKFGIKPANAFESQALLYLYKNYCMQSRCLKCQFGNKMILHARTPK